MLHYAGVGLFAEVPRIDELWPKVDRIEQRRRRAQHGHAARRAVVEGHPRDAQVGHRPGGQWRSAATSPASAPRREGARARRHRRRAWATTASSPPPPGVRQPSTRPSSGAGGGSRAPGNLTPRLLMPVHLVLERVIHPQVVHPGVLLPRTERELVAAVLIGAGVSDTRDLKARQPHRPFAAASAATMTAAWRSRCELRPRGAERAEARRVRRLQICAGTARTESSDRRPARSSTSSPRRRPGSTRPRSTRRARRPRW